MGKEDSKQGLAAVMAASIVDASRVMGVDETGTMARLDEGRSADIAPILRAYDGRVVRSVGDSMLVAFAAVSDALTCAVKVQQSLLQRNKNLPEYRKVSYRIGINLGDANDEQAAYNDEIVTVMQVCALADVGGICVSGKVLEALDGSLALDCHEIDVKQLKGNNGSSPEPVERVYRVQLPDTATGALAAGQNAQTKIVNSSIKLWSIVGVILVFIVVSVVLLVR